MHLYKRVCLLVRPSVGPYVRHASIFFALFSPGYVTYHIKHSLVCFGVVFSVCSPFTLSFHNSDMSIAKVFVLFCFLFLFFFCLAFLFLSSIFWATLSVEHGQNSACRSFSSSVHISLCQFNQARKPHINPFLRDMKSAF